MRVFWIWVVLGQVGLCTCLERESWITSLSPDRRMCGDQLKLSCRRDGEAIPTTGEFFQLHADCNHKGYLCTDNGLPVCECFGGYEGPTCSSVPEHEVHYVAEALGYQFNYTGAGPEWYAHTVCVQGNPANPCQFDSATECARAVLNRDVCIVQSTHT